MQNTHRGGPTSCRSTKGPCTCKNHFGRIFRFGSDSAVFWLGCSCCPACSSWSGLVWESTGWHCGHSGSSSQVTLDIKSWCQAGWNCGNSFWDSQPKWLGCCHSGQTVGIERGHQIPWQSLECTRNNSCWSWSPGKSTGIFIQSRETSTSG